MSSVINNNPLILAELESLRKQLAASEKDFDACRESLDRTVQQLAECEAELDELVAVVKRIHDHAMQAPYANSAIIGLAQHALAKLGADKTGEVEQDLNTCPSCGGPADNGFSREIPPSPYYCTKCMEKLK